MPASWPLNISASFPWVNQNMTRQASPFSSSTPPSSTNPNNNSTSNEHNNQTIDDDLDLD
jgi:hypothetical protein